MHSTSSIPTSAATSTSTPTTPQKSSTFGLGRIWRSFTHSGSGSSTYLGADNLMHLRTGPIESLNVTLDHTVDGASTERFPSVQTLSLTIKASQSLSVLSRILAQFPNVEKLTLVMVDSVSAFAEPGSDVLSASSKMRDVRVFGWDKEIYGWLSTADCLTRLELTDHRHAIAGEGQAYLVQKLLQRNAQTLKKLKLSYIYPVGPLDLSSLPHLRSLHIAEPLTGEKAVASERIIRTITLDQRCKLTILYLEVVGKDGQHIVSPTEKLEILLHSLVNPGELVVKEVSAADKRQAARK